MSMIKINVDFENKDSIEVGLNAFIKNIKLLFDNHLDFEENVILIYNQKKSITQDEFKECKNINTICELSTDLSIKYAFLDYSELDDPAPGSADYVILSQCYLFQKAIEAGLNDLVFDIANKIISFCLTREDTIFMDEMNVFAIDLITILALNDPKYTYLISELIIPSWDSEHAPDVISNYLPYFYKIHKFSKHNLKALASTYNEEAFESFVLLDKDNRYSFSPAFYIFLKNNKEEYEYFKSEFLLNLKKYPRSAEDEDYENIGSLLFKSISGDEIYDNKENEVFNDKNLEEVIYEFENEINEVLEEFSEADYTFNYNYVEEEEEEDEDEDEEDDYDADEYDENPEALNKEFFEKGFDNSKEILAYISSGENKEVLDTLEKIDFLSFSKKNNLEIYKRFDYYGVDFFDEILKPFIQKYFKETKKVSFLKKLFYRTNSLEDNKKEALRVIDVFYRLNGKNNLDSYSVTMIINEYKLCTYEEFVNKYFENNDEEVIVNNIRALLNPYLEKSVELSTLIQLNLLFLRKKDLFVNTLYDAKNNRINHIDADIVPFMPELSLIKVKATHLLALSYILSNNEVKNDSNIIKLENFYKDNFAEVFKNILLSSGETHYYKGNERISKEPYIYELEDYILEKNNKSKNEMFNNMRSLCSGGEQNEDIGIREYFIFRDDDIQAFLSSLMYFLKDKTSSINSKVIKCLDLFLDIAPVKTIHLISKSYIIDFSRVDENSSDYSYFLSTLKNLNIKEEYILAWKINRALHYEHKSNDFIQNDLQDNINLYSLNKDSKGRILLDKSIKYLDKDTKISFLKVANKKFPSSEYLEECKKIFDDSLLILTSRIIERDKSDWQYNEEEKLENEKEEKYYSNLMSEYIFDNQSFEKIKLELIPIVSYYIPNDIDNDIWSLPEDERHRALYLLANFAYMNRIYDYYRCLSDTLDYYPTKDMYDLLLNIGMSQSFAFDFIVTYFMEEDDYHDDEFRDAFNEIYPKIDLYNTIKDYKESKILFILKRLSEMKESQLIQFQNHDKLKIRTEINNLF